MTDFPGEYDSPWKAGLELYFQQFIEYCFPRIYPNIDWSRPYEPMDKELEQVVRDAELGKRLADKLYKVWLTSGTPAWILIHVEVQGQYESGLAERIYVYNYRCFDRFRQQVVSLVVLGDERPSWRPSSYGYHFYGFRLHLKFPIVKLLNYESNWDALEQSTNPFAVMIMAHLKTKATTDDMEQRRQWKWTLARGLYERGYNKGDILELFRLVDWMMTLPEELQADFERELERYQEENKMPLLSQIETRAMRRGTELGVQQEALRSARESVLEVLKVRFEEVPEAIAGTINSIEDVASLKQLLRQAAVIPSLGEFEQLLTSEQN